VSRVSQITVGQTPAALALLMILAQSLFGGDAGSVCVAPVEKPHAGGKSLANPSGGNRVQSYTVQIDSRPPVQVPVERSVAIGGIALEAKHLIKISGDGKSVASFHFRFSDYTEHDLCLWFRPLYETWSLTPAKGRGKTCACSD